MSDVRSRVVTSTIVALLTCLYGCAHRSTVVLLPEKDRKPSAVIVKQNDRETVLDQPYSAARQTPFGMRAYTATAQEVTSKFGAALASQPQRAAAFALYFVEGKDEFTEDS